MVNIAETASATVRTVANQLATPLDLPASLPGIVDQILRPFYEDAAAAFLFAQHPALFDN